jgi:hypothetical protein
MTPHVIEPCITRREKGTYRVVVRVEGAKKTKSFRTLEEARTFRNHLWSMRPERTFGPKGRDLVAADVRKVRQTTREQLQKAPRSKVERDGRVFTVVHL